jgi:ABC-2 type transport system ATP-binding protein
MNIFEARSIVKAYGNYVALDNVTVCIPENSIYGLLGPNGAGKTTLIRIMNQILAPDQGHLFFHDRALKPNDVFSMGYLPEERGLYKKMKVGEQALYLARLKGMTKSDALKKLKYWFEKFEMQSWWDKKVEELSKGMAQKVQFIVTILHEPKFLIFDEPFSGFDPINATMMRDEMLNLKAQGATIILSTHNMNSVEELCDNITLINKSKAILEGSVSDIQNRYKPDIFEISYSGNPASFKENLNSKFELLEQTERNGIFSAKVKNLHASADNELLSLILPHVHVTSFNELLPGMNDIFIKAVESSNQKS